MTEALLNSIVNVGIALVAVTIMSAFIICFVLVTSARTIAKSIVQGRNLRVAFALDDVTRAATLEALKQDPLFLEAIANYLGDHIKGEKGDPGNAVDPCEEVMRIFDNPEATATLINGLATRAGYQVAQESRQLLAELNNNVTQQLAVPVGELAHLRDELRSYVADLETINQLLAAAQNIVEGAQHDTADLRATAAQLEQLIATSNLLKRLLVDPQPA
ncbi:MAG: hypothetical protein WAP74_02720 [Patescibacteria group bacterium]